jgi:hypothetical protein
MMDHNKTLQNGNGFDSYSQPPQVEQQSLPNVLHDNANPPCNYSDYFSATDNNIIPASYTYPPSNYEQQQVMFYNATPTTSYAPQYTASLNVIANNSSQTNCSEIFFEIPLEFKIIIKCIPTTSTVQNQFQQDYTSNIVADNLQTQDYTSSSIVADNLQNYNSSNIINNDLQTPQDFNSSSIVNNNSQIQFQQNSNQSFTNFNNFRA